MKNKKFYVIGLFIATGVASANDNFMYAGQEFRDSRCFSEADATGASHHENGNGVTYIANNKDIVGLVPIVQGYFKAEAYAKAHNDYSEPSINRIEKCNNTISSYANGVSLNPDDTVIVFKGDKGRHKINIRSAIKCPEGQSRSSVDTAMNELVVQPKNNYKQNNIVVKPCLTNEERNFKW